MSNYLSAKDRALNFSSCKYSREIHEIIKEKLELPEFYGGNLDALWDAVTGIMYLPANIKIIFKPQTNATFDLTNEVEQIISVFEEAEKEFGQIKVTVER